MLLTHKDLLSHLLKLVFRPQLRWSSVLAQWLRLSHSLFNWTRVDLKCCVGFRYTEKWFNYKYICIFIHIYIWIFIIFHYRLLRDIEYSFLCYTVGPCFFIYFIYSSMHIGEGNGNPLQYSCLANPMDGGAWWAAVHVVARSRTWLSDFTFTFHFHALEKEMATNSSVLAWRIPGTGEAGGLPSLGSHRVGHNWSNLAAAAVACIY